MIGGENNNIFFTTIKQKDNKFSSYRRMKILPVSGFTRNKKQKKRGGGAKCEEKIGRRISDTRATMILGAWQKNYLQKREREKGKKGTRLHVLENVKRNKGDVIDKGRGIPIGVWKDLRMKMGQESVQESRSDLDTAISIFGIVHGISCGALLLNGDVGSRGRCERGRSDGICH